MRTGGGARVVTTQRRSHEQERQGGGAGGGRGPGAGGGQGRRRQHCGWLFSCTTILLVVTVTRLRQPVNSRRDHGQTYLVVVTTSRWVTFEVQE